MPDRKYTRWMRIRLLSVAGLLLVLALMVLVRLFHLQVSQADWLRGLAENQYLKEITLEPMRGAIVDRNGAQLAVSVLTDSVFVMPAELEDPKRAASLLAVALDLDAAQLAATFRRRKQFTWVKRRITPGESGKVRQLDLPGLHLTRESRRYYPARELAASLIGFAGDGRGLEGLELLFDGRLRGSTVLAQGLRDARGNILFADGVAVGDATDELRLVLTIDLTIQEIVEGELERAVRDSGAKRGMAVVMDPHTGEILALANSPTFNPNTYWEFPQQRYRNRSISDCFEPGSTMKVFSLATALQAGAIRPTESFDCGPGRLKVGPHTIHDSGQRSSGPVPLADVLIQSRNTCTALIGMRLGREGLWQGLHGFGFGRSTGVDLPGESRCRLRKPNRWYEVDLATISFGQGVSVNALQLAAGLSALANGGVWMRPMILREIQGSEDRVLQRFEPEPAGRVVDRRWAELVRDMMVGVTRPGGTGTRAAIPGFSVAGKTGTAQKADPIAGGYSKDRRVASFIGFVPAERPRIVGVVIIDEPQTSPYGGVVAAPVFARLGEAVLSYLGVYPESTGQSPSAVAARTSGGRAGPAQGADEIEGSILQASAAEVVAIAPGSFSLPDLRGLSARAALRRLGSHGLEVSLSGSGRVVGQRPAPGTAMRAPARVSLVLERRGAGGTELATLRGQPRASASER